jgi:tetratricopeptide (TPR) repeat protein
LKLLLRQSELEADGKILHNIRHEAAIVARDRLGDTATAIGLYSQLFDDDPADELAGNSLKSLLLETKAYESLIRILTKLVELAAEPPERAELRLQLSRVYDENLDNPQAAISELGAILEEVPNYASAVVALSKIYEKLGANEEMAELLERQVRQAEADGDNKVKIELQMRLGEVCESRLGDIDRAIATFRSVLAIQPRQRAALESLIRLHEHQGDRVEAATLLESLVAIADDSDRSILNVRLADMRERVGDEKGALEALHHALASEPRNKAIRQRALSLSEKMGDWEDVGALLSDEAELVESVVDKVALLREAARIRADKSQDWPRAAAFLEKASVFAPNDRELLLSLCDAYTASGRAREAATALERIVESYGGRRTKELGEIHRRLAQAYLSQREPERAKDELEKAFRIEPGNVRVIALLADVCLQINDAKRAQQLYSSLIIQIPKLGPDSPISKAEIYAHRGEANRILGEKQKAISDFERALQTDSTMESVRSKLAELKS